LSPRRAPSRLGARGLLGALALSLGLQAQQDPAVVPVGGAAAAAVGVLFARGFDDDPEGQSGLAAVVAAARLEQGRRAGGELLASGLRVGGDYAIVFAVVAPGRLSEAVAFARAASGDGEALEDDALRLAIARAALAADDAEFLFPGDVLMTRARQRLGKGAPFARPPAGTARECSALTPAALRVALASPAPARFAALGAVGPEWEQALRGLPGGAAPCPARGQATCSARWGQRAMTEDVSLRADSPYLGAAFAAPGPPARAAFAVAVEVARARALRRFELRGRELFARAPLVRWSWLEADPIAMFYRRGEDPVQVLPGERGRAPIAAEVQATRGELEALLQDLRDRAPTEAELASARAALRRGLGLPTAGEATPWAAEPATYPGRVQLLLLRAHHDVDVRRVERVTGPEVADALAEALQPARASWHAIRPRARDGLGYRRR